MQYRYLGASGLSVSAISFGSWVTFGNQLDDEGAAACMRQAFDAGINFFDNAEVYAAGQSETLMGRVIKKAGWKRSEIVISTKIFWGGKGQNQRGLSRKHVLEGTADALARLQLDYVDLLFCHRPDVHTPIEETVRAMSHLVNQGRALYWGTSEWSAEQIRAAHAVARRERLAPPTMEQPEYHMFHRERFEVEYAPLYRELGLGTTIWSPLAGGLLTGKYGNGIPAGSRLTVPGYEWLRDRVESAEGQERIAKVEKLRPIAADLRCELPQLALAWCLDNPNVSTAIIGASKPEQVASNVKAVDVRLTDDVRARIEEVLGNKPEAPKDWRA